MIREQKKACATAVIQRSSLELDDSDVLKRSNKFET